jgi:hypothetical protein
VTRFRYSAIVLRYVHDLVSGEFVNVGLLLVCPEQGVFKFKVTPRLKRVLDFFPGTRAMTIKSALRVAELASKKIPEYEAMHMVGSAGDRNVGVAEVAYRMVPHDDSALQWSEAFSGLTADAMQTFDRLVDRLLLRYLEANERVRRTDDQVWRTFSKVLENRNVADKLQEHEIKAKVETVKFKHALKNGKWHVMEPVSFDLSSEETITDKAKKLLGQMSLLRGY